MNKIKAFNKPVSYGFLALTLATLAIVAMLASGTAQNNTDTMMMSSNTTRVLCDYSGSEATSIATVEKTEEMISSYAWSCSETERLLSANGLPNHEVGIFNRNPIAEQNISSTFTLSPVLTDTATELGGPRGTIAYALNGVKFDPGTAGTCNDSGDDCSPRGGTGIWSLEALGENSFNFGEDMNNAHVQPGGLYHYHGIPENYLTKLSDGQEALTLVGWAADGFPIYARYGYSDSTDTSSTIKVMTGSYQTKAIPDENRPSTDLYAMGTFTQDWEYVERLSELDECNGLTGVTPEFPNGIYHYYATDTFPFVTRCVKGEVTVRGGRGRRERPAAGPVGGAGGPGGSRGGPGGQSAGGPSGLGGGPDSPDGSNNGPGNKSTDSSDN